MNQELANAIRLYSSTGSHKELSNYLIDIKSGFPDAIIRRFNGKGWVRERAEFEYKSSNYRIHQHPINDCDIVICWIHDRLDCPLEVWEMAELIKLLPRDKLGKLSSYNSGGKNEN